MHKILIPLLAFSPMLAQVDNPDISQLMDSGVVGILATLAMWLWWIERQQRIKAQDKYEALLLEMSDVDIAKLERYTRLQRSTQETAKLSSGRDYVPNENSTGN